MFEFNSFKVSLSISGLNCIFPSTKDFKIRSSFMLTFFLLGKPCRGSTYFSCLYLPSFPFTRTSVDAVFCNQFCYLFAKVSNIRFFETLLVSSIVLPMYLFGYTLFLITSSNTPLVAIIF